MRKMSHYPQGKRRGKTVEWAENRKVIHIVHKVIHTETAVWIITKSNSRRYSLKKFWF